MISIDKSVVDQLLVQAYAYGDLAERTPLDNSAGVAIVEQYARNLRAAAMTFYHHRAEGSDKSTNRMASFALATATETDDPADDRIAAGIFALLDAAFALGPGALTATITGDARGIRERALVAWAQARKLTTRTEPGIEGVTIRTLYVQFPASPFPIASLMVPVSFAARRT